MIDKQVRKQAAAREENVTHDTVHPGSQILFFTDALAAF
jgi:hypothetical protein